MWIKNVEVFRHGAWGIVPKAELVPNDIFRLIGVDEDRRFRNYIVNENEVNEFFMFERYLFDPDVPRKAN